MTDNQYYDLSDVAETFDLEETRRLLNSQLESLHDDIGEGMIDNFKILYQRYTSIKNNTGTQDPDTIEEVKDRFYGICDMFVARISDEFGVIVDDEYIEDHYEELPSIALQFYLFFVLNLRSNLYNVLLTYINQHVEDLAGQFEEMRQRKDSITEVNRSLEDPNIALIASNIYDVVDYVMDVMDDTTFFDCMEPGYVALAPIKNMYDSGEMTGNFSVVLRDLLKENISMKGRICFDIICKLKGYQMV